MLNLAGRMRPAGICLIVLLLSPRVAGAQNWSFDARDIALGGVAGDTPSVAALEDTRGERSIVIPLGLIQLLQNLDVFRPDSDDFDLIRAVEYAASPLHYVVGRDRATESNTGRNLSVDIRDARLSRNLNDYRGIHLENQPPAEGLAAPNWGGTIPVHRGADGWFHGIYLGAGPYISLSSAVSFDQRLIDLLASDTDVVLRNDRLRLGNDTQGQGAAAITGGYRGLFPLPSRAGSSNRNLLIVAANYNCLRGFLYERAETSLAIDTDSNGLATIAPASGNPLVITRRRSTSGRGAALDLGVGAVINRWELGLGVRGIGNHIDWSGVERNSYALGFLFNGGDFSQSGELATDDVRVTLPVDTHVTVAYRGAPWGAVADVARGFQGTSFHGGYERHLGGLDLRGGTFYTRERWHPSAGLGLNIGRRVSLDLAVFGTTSNAAREQRAAVAASLRFRS